MRRFAYTFPHVPAKRSVAASCWGVVLAEEMANLPVDRITDFSDVQNNEPDQRAFCGLPRQRTGMLNVR